MSTWVTCENRTVTKANKKPKANVIQKMFTWQGIKFTTHQLSSPELQDCTSKHLVAGNLRVFICTCDLSTWTEICFPSLLRVRGVCSPGTLGGSTEGTTGVKAPSSQAAFCCCLLLSPFHQMAFLRRLQSESRPQDKSEEGKTRLYTSQEQILIRTQLISTLSTANSAWTPCYKSTFPSNKRGIHPKN